MEDKNLRELFSAFNPELTSESSFMKGLEARLDAVEIIREWQASQSRRRRTALVVAALSGMAIGFLLSFTMPYILTRLYELSVGVPAFVLNMLPVAAWAVVGLLSVIVATNAYAITLALRTTIKTAVRLH